MPGTSVILRLYFVAVSIVTLFTVMFAATDLLTIALRHAIPGANQPEWGLENCPNLNRNSPENKPLATQEDTQNAGDEDKLLACEARNADALRNWQNQQIANLIRNISLIIISLPLFIIHFRIVYKDWKGERT